MKKLLIKQIVLYAMILMVIAACNSTTKEKKGTTSDGKEAYVEVGEFDAVKIKDQIVETIREVPDEKEIATMLNESGASYISDLTVQPEQADQLMTRAEQSFGLGLYSFDLLYASVYNRGDVASQISEVSEDLINELGLSNDLLTSKNYLARIKENADNKDSLDYLVSEDLNYFHQQMSESNQPGVYALSVIGSNVEALYILSQTALLANNNEQLLGLMNKQKERVTLVSNLLELMSGDEEVKPYYEQFKPVVSMFQDDQQITQEKLQEIGSAMETFRNEILK